MPGGNVGHGGGGFSGGHSGGFSSSHSSGRSSGLLTGLVIGSILSKNGSSGGSSGSIDPTQGGKYKRVKNKKATYIVSAIFLALTILFIGLAIGFRFDNSYVLVQAKAVNYEIDYYSSTPSHKYYYTYYSFTTLDGKEMTGIKSQLSWDGLDGLSPSANPYSDEDIRQYYLKEADGYRDLNIYYLKSNPSKIYDEAAKEYGEIPSKNTLYIILAVIAGIITIVIFFAGIYKYELDPEYAAREREKERNKPVDGKRRCAYCGTWFDEKEDKCPNCGASQK